MLRISLQTSLQVSSLACKYVFYRPDHNSKVLKCKNIIYQAQSSKSRLEKWDHLFSCFVFSADDNKNLVAVREKCLSESERILFSSFWKSYGLFGSELPLARYQILEILPKLWLLLWKHQQKIQKMSHFWHCNDHNSRSKHEN